MIKNLFYSFDIIDKIDWLDNDDPDYSLRKDIFKEEIKTDLQTFKLHILHGNICLLCCFGLCNSELADGVASLMYPGDSGWRVGQLQDVDHVKVYYVKHL